MTRARVSAAHDPAGESEVAASHVRAVLAARARVAARPPQAAVSSEERIELVVFQLAGGRFALEAAHVREVYHLRSLTSIPGTPPVLAGVTPHRGRILAVIDLRPLLELPATGISELNRVLVLSAGADELGILADAVEGFGQIPAADVQTVSRSGAIRDEFIRGVTGDRLAVLDGARLLAAPELRVGATIEP